MRSATNQSEILTLATNPKFRRLGITTELMEQTIRNLYAEHVKQILLKVSEHTIAAPNLYQSLKFKPASLREACYVAHVISIKKRHRESNTLVMQSELV